MAFTHGIKKTAGADWNGIAKNVKSVGSSILAKPKAKLGLGLAGAGAAGYMLGKGTSKKD